MLTPTYQKTSSAGTPIGSELAITFATSLESLKNSVAMRRAVSL